MKRTRITLALMAAALLVPASASADMYQCKDKNGRVWLRNYKVKGERCRLVMKTDDGPATPPAASGGSPGGSKKSSGASRYTPPTLSDTPRAVNPDPKSSRERRKLYEPYIQEAADKYKLPAAFLRAVMRVESNFKYRALSSAGAMGLMQLMPMTAREMGVVDPYDPRQNIMGGARLIRTLAERFGGDIVQVLSAYHAGSGAVKSKDGGIPYEATEGYVRAVLDHYYRYKSLGK